MDFKDLLSASKQPEKMWPNRNIVYLDSKVSTSVKQCSFSTSE